MRGQFNQPADIERESMRIISSELERRNIQLQPDQAPIIKRVIHTTADFDYAANLTFISDAVTQGVQILSGGTIIITDTNMSKAGISKVGLEKLGSTVECFMTEPEVAQLARERATTRAVVAMERAIEQYPNSIFAVGNAPTALFALGDAIKSGVRPGLVIAVPVGFVNVLEAKEQTLALCQNFEIPAIVALGHKGGSNVAAAICNALIYLASDMLEPETRNR